MTDVAKELRADARASATTLARPEIVTEQVSVDGTRKWLLRLRLAGARRRRRPRSRPSTSPRPSAARCASRARSAARSTARFCHTGTQRLVRNLTAQEIVGQILLARDRIGDWPGAEAAEATGACLPTTERKITNIVLMGMGEPLYNFDNVKAAMEIAADGEGALGLQAAHHAVDLGHRAGDRPLGRGDRHHARHLAARDER